MTNSSSHPAPTLAEYLEQRGPLTSLYAVLCTVHWLTAIAGRRDVTIRDVRSAYPRPGAPWVPRVGAPGDFLRRAATAGLLEGVTRLDDAPDLPGESGAGAERHAFRLTPLGRAVAESLPDHGRVGVLRGMGRAAPGRGRATLARARLGVGRAG
jgi:hypothetical protein